MKSHIKDLWGKQSSIGIIFIRKRPQSNGIKVYFKRGKRQREQARTRARKIGEKREGEN
jgi:hypothetical protein